MSSAMDLVVIGGGTAGLVAARVAASLGAQVALIERARLGGDCLRHRPYPVEGILGLGLCHRIVRRDVARLLRGWLAWLRPVRGV